MASHQPAFQSRERSPRCSRKCNWVLRILSVSQEVTVRGPSPNPMGVPSQVHPDRTGGPRQQMRSPPPACPGEGQHKTAEVSGKPETRRRKSTANKEQAAKTPHVPVLSHPLKTHRVFAGTSVCLCARVHVRVHFCEHVRAPRYQRCGAGSYRLRAI